MKTHDRITAIHPLVAKKRTGLANYHEWLQAFDRADDDDALLGYLHTGFAKSLDKCSSNEPKYSDEDRIIFYLSHADGWSDGEGLGNGENGSYDHRWPTPSKQSMSLAKKAVSVLCAERFKAWISLDPYEKNFIDETYTSEKVLPVLMYFFSEEQRGGAIVPRNGAYSFPSDSHLEDTLRKFVLKLIKVILTWQNEEGLKMKYRMSEDEKAAFDKAMEKDQLYRKAKTWAVEMLCSMNELEILRSKYRGVTFIDDVVVSALETIESRGKIDIGKGERLVQSHQEALKTGSKVAWLLHEIYIMSNRRPKEKTSTRVKPWLLRRR